MSKVNSDLISSGILMDGGFLASHNSKHVRRHSSSLSYHRKFCGRLGAQESANAAFNTLAAHRHVVYATVFLLILLGNGWGNLSIYEKV